LKLHQPNPLPAVPLSTGNLADVGALSAQFSASVEGPFAAVSGLSAALTAPAPQGEDASGLVIAAVDLFVDSVASTAYIDIASDTDLASALSDVGLVDGVVFDDSLARLMSVLAAPSAVPTLSGGPSVGAAGALLEGVAGGLVLDAGDLAGLVDARHVGDLPTDGGVGSTGDPVALLAQMASQGTSVGLLGGYAPVSADPFDPFNQSKS
jgi:hypothetical protein